MSDDLTLSKLAFQYFCNSVIGAILILLAIILMYDSYEILHIDTINGLLFLKGQNPVSLLFVIAIILKFFPINLYFYITKSRDQLSNIVLNFTFIINGTVGLYLLLRVLLLLFDDNETLFQVAIAIGFVLIFYSNYKMFRTKHLKVFILYLLLINLCFVLITFLVNKSPLASLLYVIN